MDPAAEVAARSSGAVLRFDLLGPLRVTVDGQDRTPSPPKQRALLVLLLLRRDEAVPFTTLVDDLWGETSPRCALPALQGYVSALRRRIVGEPLGPDLSASRHPLLRTESSGYRMVVSPESVDVHRFNAAVGEGRRLSAEGHRREARDALERALGLWRGPLLSGQPIAGRLQALSTRFEEERLCVLQERIDADMLLGRGEALVGELEELCLLYPLREPLYERLMVALSCCGRHAEALGVYARARSVLVDEAGVEPGDQLRRVHQAILGGADLLPTTMTRPRRGASPCACGSTPAALPPHRDFRNARQRR